MAYYLTDACVLILFLTVYGINVPFILKCFNFPVLVNLYGMNHGFSGSEHTTKKMVQYICAYLLLNLAVYNVECQVPPPEPTEPPTGGCAYTPDCENTYGTAVMNGDACMAAQNYRTCTTDVEGLCTLTIPSDVTAMVAHATAEVQEKCQVDPVSLPECAVICESYKTDGMAKIDNGDTSGGCDVYKQFIQCLHNQHLSGCMVLTFLQEAETYGSSNCPGISTASTNVANGNGGKNNGISTASTTVASGNEGKHNDPSIILIMATALLFRII